MPFIVRWPSVIAPGQVNESAILGSVDLFPTLCSITGSPIPSEYRLDGEERSDPILRNKNRERSAPLFWEFSSKKQSTPDDDPMPRIALRWKEWKLLVFIDGSEVELYNMKNDWEEKENVAGQNKMITDKLTFEALRWFNQSFREFANK
jgi:arylsulfatase A-like enzyme